MRLQPGPGGADPVLERGARCGATPGQPADPGRHPSPHAVQGVGRHHPRRPGRELRQAVLQLGPLGPVGVAGGAGLGLGARAWGLAVGVRAGGWGWGPGAGGEGQGLN